MAREGISFEQVAAAADALLAAGEKPTLRALRAHLRTGSPNTIHRHLGRWRAQRPPGAGAGPALDLPAAVVRGIRLAIEQGVAEVRAELQEELAHAQAAAAELATAGEALELERDAMAAQFAALTSERDPLAGRVVEQSAEMMRLNEGLEHERKATEQARTDLAGERLIGAGLRERIAQLQTDIEQVRADLRHEQEARVQGQLDLATLEAVRTAAVERVSELSDREHALGRELTELRRKMDQMQEAARWCPRRGSPAWRRPRNAMPKITCASEKKRRGSARTVAAEQPEYTG